MILSAVVRRAPAVHPLALACAVSLCACAGAALADDQTLPTVNVLGARFATVITAADIRRAGATDVNQALRKVGGVYGRQSIDGSADFALDLRGFGANSGQNLVVMLDGVRLSENDLGGAVLATIPIEMELGATIGSDKLGATARAFRHDLRDEIFYDPTVNVYGANTNLDPTERKGVELDVHAALTRSLRLVARLQHVKARFTEGPNDGRDMVLVPRNVASARLSWVPGNGHSADVGLQWVDRQRYGSDFANDCGVRMPSYATLDARYARQFGAWEFAVSGLNLTDKQHFSQAFSCRRAIYPSDGRQLKMSARYDF